MSVEQMQSSQLEEGEKMKYVEQTSYKINEKRAAEKANKSCQHAKTFTKYFLSKKGYKCLDLDSRQAGYHVPSDFQFSRKNIP